MSPLPTSAVTVTGLLQAWGEGDRRALDRLLPLVYGELQRLARSYMWREGPEHTLEPDALVHEAFVRLVDQRSVRWQDRSHFYGVAAWLMRRVLLKHAEAKGARKRGGGRWRVPLDEAMAEEAQLPEDLLALEEALEALGELDSRQARVVELRFLAGHTVEETAQLLGVSPITVKREWRLARAWLQRRLRHRELGEAP